MGDLRDERSPNADVSLSLVIAEQAAEKVITKIQATNSSEKARTSVINYVRRLLGDRLHCMVYPFGSVPLKTYLPDGDIDLTAVCLEGDETFAEDVHDVLYKEQLKRSEFVVHDVQLIRAEVKIVKCLVQNIVVDISFNQVGGLCTLCFLEKIDRLIGKDHLFKRSIILIKAWCYYESRILGAHHGLISTYALETLVLYIFHLFHTSLNGPLAVLYKFLDYFSKFDWDNYCISVNGPVRISSLPEIIAEMPDNDGRDLLLSSNFLRECLEAFVVPSRVSETSSRQFPTKHLNIVDPLKENNNLGRSVSKGNFCRIRSAFSYGARKLGAILSGPEEIVTEELRSFFMNTLQRHGSGRRPDVQDPAYKVMYHWCGDGVPRLEMETYKDDEASPEKHSLDHDKLSARQDSMKTVQSSEAYHVAIDTGIQNVRLSGDAKDLASSEIQNLINDVSEPSPLSKEDSFKSLWLPLEFVQSTGNGNLKDCSDGGRTRDPASKKQGNSESPTIAFSQAPHVLCQPSGRGDTRENGCSEDMSKHPGKGERSGFPQKKELGCEKEVVAHIASPHRSSVLSSDDFRPGCLELCDSIRSPDCLSSLSDLSGDYDNHTLNLQSVQRWYKSCIHPVYPLPAPFIPDSQRRDSWDPVRQSVLSGRNAFSQTNAGSIVPRGQFFYQSPSAVAGVPFGMEESPKTRGTGTYFPNMNHYKDRPLVRRGKNQGPPRSPRSNGHGMTPSAAVLPEKNNIESARAQFPGNQGGGRSIPLGRHQEGFTERKARTSPACTSQAQHIHSDFESNWHLSRGPTVLERSKQQSTDSTVGHDSRGISTPSVVQHSDNLSTLDQGRVAGGYHLKNNDDFPPLSS